MKAMMAAAAALVVGVAAVPAQAAETITATFTQADGGQTTELFSNTVRVLVSGTGFSRGPNLNDAFYQLDPPGAYDPSFYQLTFGTTTLTPLNPAQNAVNFIVGGRPVYEASHVYSFLLNTGTAVPSVLHFGVGDGQFGDNGGSYTISISAVPEPAIWAMFITGFGLIGGMLRRQARRSQTRFTERMRPIATGRA